MATDPADRRVAEHVAAFNAAVRSGDWPSFAARFTPGACMRFVGVPAGPYIGRAAIAEAYARQPPADTLAVLSHESDGPTDRVRFAWSRGGAGRMVIGWDGEAVRDLEISFEPAAD
jgi:hypothetical protein